MTGRAQAARLADGRLHLHHGPIDIIAEGFGAAGAVDRAYHAAARRFAGVLDELVVELPLLRRPLGAERPRGDIARAMCDAIAPYDAMFVTPMAAVAGAVADTVLAAMVGAAPLDRAYVNNGGDIALHLGEGQLLAAGIVDDADRPCLDARLTIDQHSPVRGIATSGWRVGSQSLGIADAVTVLAATAAQADVAATLIANAVTVDHPAVARAPANALRDDGDLGTMPVTVRVGPLPHAAIARALDAGVARAAAFLDRGTIFGVHLSLQGQNRTVGAAALPRVAA